jgi:uncharacterized protein (DUF1810 family)
VTDPFRLERFVSAQEGSYAQALAEMRAGRKTGHWIWFVLPQVAGLGFSATSREYAISGLDEARAYVAHPVLGPRLLEITRAVAEARGPTAYDVMGPDDVKLHSSMTLFAAAAPDEPLFRRVLDRFFDGRPDPATTSRI